MWLVLVVADLKAVMLITFKVNDVGTQKSPHFETLQKEEATSQKEEKGIWQKV